MGFIQRSIDSNAPAAAILIRFAVGSIFLSEGIQKFLYPLEQGVGRFTKIGIPSPQILAPLVGTFEIVCGVLLVAGLLTRLAAIPLIVIILVAIATTKVPIFIDKGFWPMAHEARTDLQCCSGHCFC